MTVNTVVEGNGVMEIIIYIYNTHWRTELTKIAAKYTAAMWTLPMPTEQVSPLGNTFFYARQGWKRARQGGGDHMVQLANGGRIFAKFQGHA